MKMFKHVGNFWDFITNKEGREFRRKTREFNKETSQHFKKAIKNLKNTKAVKNLKNNIRLKYMEVDIEWFRGYFEETTDEGRIMWLKRKMFYYNNEGGNFTERAHQFYRIVDEKLSELEEKKERKEKKEENGLVIKRKQAKIRELENIHYLIGNLYQALGHPDKEGYLLEQQAIINVLKQEVKEIKLKHGKDCRHFPNIENENQFYDIGKMVGKE